ncbi:MAG: gp16 family protein [Acidovorax sp.]|uniref:gp16 family protein n=1 Tax=Acidovorax sp. TaxID=1872122 RepID=UPI00391C4E28
MTTAKAPANNRRASLIKLIHVAKRELGQKHGLDEPTYRSILLSIGKSESLTTMGVPSMVDVLEHLKTKGFQVRPKAGDRTQTINPDTSKVRALWLFLHALGVVNDPSERALAAYVKRIAKVDDLRWVRSSVTDTLIETLKKWAMRFLPAAVAALRQELMEARRAAPLSERQIELAQRAELYLIEGEGFDKHWWAWECFMGALGRPIHANLAVLKAKEVTC